MCILRVTVINLEETPKYLLGKNRDEEVVQHLQNIATKYNRPCSLTAEQLRACGTLASEQNGEMSLFQTLTVHIRGLFVTKKLGISTVLLWASWMLVGLAFPLYIVFLPEYLMSRGADFGDGSIYTTYRDYSIASACSILGPVVGGYLCNTPRVGRKGTMVSHHVDFEHELYLIHSAVFGSNNDSNFLLCLYTSQNPSSEPWN